MHTWMYSYYYPDLGGVNCHTSNWDADAGVCRAVLLGRPWRDWLGRLVALGYDYQDYMGCTLHIVAPDAVVGDYVIGDICPACGADFVDFLADRQVLPWRSLVQGYITCP